MHQSLVLPSLSHQGAIPESLGNLVELEGLYLNDNQLEGRFPLFLGWSVPTDRPIFSLILRREHPCIFGQPGEFRLLVPLREPALRSIFLVFRDGQCPLTI